VALLQQSLDISACRVHSSKPAAAGLLAMLGQTDGERLYRFIDPARHTMRAVPKSNKNHANVRGSTDPA